MKEGDEDPFVWWPRTEGDAVAFLSAQSVAMEEDIDYIEMTEEEALEEGIHLKMREHLANDRCIVVTSCTRVTTMHCGAQISGELRPTSKIFGMAEPDAEVTAQGTYTPPSMDAQMLNLRLADVFAWHGPVGTEEELQELGYTEEQAHHASDTRRKYWKGTWMKFLQLMDDDATCLNLLSFPGDGLAPAPIYIAWLSDDRKALKTWDQPVFSHRDLETYSGWFLATHPLSFTRTHRDCSGFLTYVSVIRGCKVWMVLRWKKDHKPTDGDWKRRNSLMARHDVEEIEYSKRPPWITSKGFRHDIYAKKKGEWEKHRVAEWKAYMLMETMTL